MQRNGVSDGCGDREIRRLGDGEAVQHEEIGEVERLMGRPCRVRRQGSTRGWNGVGLIERLGRRLMNPARPGHCTQSL